MEIFAALEIVLSLAEQGKLSQSEATGDDDLYAEYERQEEALKTVREHAARIGHR